MEEIKKGMFVSMTYEMLIQNDELDGEEVQEVATEEKPLEFVFGEEEMLDAFEQKLAGKKEGDEVEFWLTPEEAYGARDERNVRVIPRKVFEIKGQFDTERVFVSNVLPMLDVEGHKYYGTVLAVDENSVTLDFNHPLAGETLHFKGKILGVRKATKNDRHHSCPCCEDCEEEGGCSGGCGGCQSKGSNKSSQKHS